MAQRVEQNYERLFEVYEKKSEEELRKIIMIDKEINKKQREIESQCLFLITKQQPIVSDLRVVTAACAGVTPESHAAALRTMEACQIRLV